MRLPSISPHPSPSGAIFLRWHLAHREYEFTLPLKWADQRDRRKAEEIADIIKQDIKHDALGLQPPSFDPTLKKYQPGLKIEKIPQVPSLLTVWVKFVDFKIQEGKIQETTLRGRYSQISQLLYKLPQDLLTAEKAKALRLYLSSKYKINTQFAYYQMFSACANWAVDQEIWKNNPYKKDTKELKNQICPETGKAYSNSEAIKILGAFATDRFTLPRAYIGHSYYAQFVKFLFLTGVRPQLAIALEWEQIVWEQGRPIKIYFDRAYSSGILKPSKGDRNGKNTPRVFPVNSELAELIMAIPRKETIRREPTISRHLKTLARPHYPNLVFSSSRRWYIDIDDFTFRVFKPVVNGLVKTGEVAEYLPTYHARHTTLNRWLEAGISEDAIAALLDTSPEIIRKHYRNDQRYRENLANSLSLPPLTPPL